MREIRQRRQIVDFSYGVVVQIKYGQIATHLQIILTRRLKKQSHAFAIRSRAHRCLFLGDKDALCVGDNPAAIRRVFGACDSAIAIKDHSLSSFDTSRSISDGKEKPVD